MIPATARLVQIELEGDVGAAEGALLVRGDAHPFALAGAWAGGGALVGSEPIAVADPAEDPFDVLDRQPGVRPLKSPRLKGSDPLSRSGLDVAVGGETLDTGGHGAPPPSVIVRTGTNLS